MLGCVGCSAALTSATTVGNSYNVGRLNDRPTRAVTSGLVRVAGSVLVTAAHGAALLRPGRFVAGVRAGNAPHDPAVAQCAKRGRTYPEDPLVTHPGARLCRDDHGTLGAT